MSDDSNLIEMNCPKCNAPIAFHSKDAGHTGKCPDCDAHFTIPSRNSRSQSIPKFDPSEFPSSKPFRPKRKPSPNFTPELPPCLYDILALCHLDSQTSIYTPRGLQVRVGVRYAFSFISRLRDFISSRKFLLRVEDFENYPSFIQVVFTFTLLFCGFENKYLLLIFPTLFRSLFSFIKIRNDLITKFPFTLALPFVRLYSIISGYGFFLAPMLFLSYLRYGYLGSLFVLATLYLGHNIEMNYDDVFSRRTKKTYGKSIYGSELSFLQAYWFYASKFHIFRPFTISDDELISHKWRSAFLEYVYECPSAASQCQLTDYELQLLR